MRNPGLEWSTRLLIAALFFFLIFAAAIALPANAAPSTIVTVTNTNDSGAGSLREAIATANPGDTIVFSVTVPATIKLSSQLDITQTLTISGPGSSLLTISGNNATRVMSVSSAATLNLSNVTIANGLASSSNGAGMLNNGNAIIAKSIFANNEATIFGIGGAIYNDAAGTLSVTDSTLSGNVARTGGGIANFGTATLANSTLSSNAAVHDSGGIFNSGPFAITNTTFYSNTSVGLNLGGGAILNGTSGTLTAINSTFSRNSAQNGATLYRLDGTITLSNSIVANSVFSGNCFGTITNGGNNIDDGITCGWGSSNGSMSSTNPQLGLFQNNGGPTLTMALLHGSPAIDGVTFDAPNGCPSTDQRGFTRPSPTGGRCDIGAFEFQFPTLTSLAPSTSPAFGPSLTLTLTGASFVSGSVALWNNVPLASTYISSTRLTALVPAGHLTSAGVVTVTVANPAPDSAVATPALPFTLSKVSQTIAFAPLADVTISTAPFPISATASSGLAVTFTAAGACSVAGNVVMPLAVGSCTVTAHQPGDATYDPAPDVPRTLTITNALLYLPLIVR